MEGYFDNLAIHDGMPAEDLAYIVSQYDGEIAFADHLIGRILDEIDRLGIAEETLVIVTSDHGEEFFEHGHKGHRINLYDESILVPLIARGPGVAPNAAGIGGQVSLIDVAPTILAAAGLPIHAEMVGEDLGAALAGRAGDAGRGEAAKAGGARKADAHAAEGPAASLAAARPAPFAVAQVVGGRGSDTSCMMFALRSPALKAIVDDCFESSEVYDLARDPKEKERIPEESRVECGEILRRLGEFRTAMRDAAKSLPSVGTEPVPIDPVLEERLRALGYVD
jgi:hypothetical protein